MHIVGPLLGHCFGFQVHLATIKHRYAHILQHVLRIRRFILVDHMQILPVDVDGVHRISCILHNVFLHSFYVYF